MDFIFNKFPDYSYNDGYRLVILIIGILISLGTIYNAREKWQKKLGKITLICSIMIPILVEAIVLDGRHHTMYGSDFEMLGEAITMRYYNTDMLLADLSYLFKFGDPAQLHHLGNFAGPLIVFLYFILAVLFIICTIQLVKIWLIKNRIKQRDQKNPSIKNPLNRGFLDF